jgi:uncharacterized protein
MRTTTELYLSPEEAFLTEKTLVRLAEKLRVDVDKISDWKIRKKSIDARKANIIIRLVIEYVLKDDAVGKLPELLLFEQPTRYIDCTNATREVVIIGCGPAGMFAALRLLEAGIRPVILERGKDVRERRRDLAAISKDRIVNPDSNYCFGEGGAGTYSDGKLYTRSNKRGNVAKILQVFVEHGSAENILYEAHPHIGTNKLPAIVTAMRETIERFGGKVLFNKRVTDIVSHNNQLQLVKTADGEEFAAKQVILATGHSARDIFELLHKKGIEIEAKPFALGVRIEHPQELIDKIQYHCDVRSEFLPPSSYSLVEQVNGRGVFSFCMCPGGIIAPAGTAPGEVVVNGWSPSKRNGKFANSGMVVSIEEKDWQKYSKHGALAAMNLQAEIEQLAFVKGGSNLTAPAQRVPDFVNKKISVTLPETSYIPGVIPASLDEVLPAEVASRLRGGLQAFGKKMRGYFTHEAVLVGVESRTSSPVRIPRDKETLEHPQLKGFYPCGEGAGYAGGIVSAAMDGERVAEAIINSMQ